jgi:hypothetical protein
MTEQEEIKVQDYETFYLERCSACTKPIGYSNGWKDGARLCLDCASALIKNR